MDRTEDWLTRTPRPPRHAQPRHLRLIQGGTKPSTLSEAEQYSREVYGYSEIDYEPNNASWLGSQPEQKLDPEAALRQLAQFEAEARDRGIAHTTFRRITEALGLNGKQRQELRALLLIAGRSSMPLRCGAFQPKRSRFQSMLDGSASGDA
ncbi:hypothetical protein ABZ467_35775 [Streptomyces sp. NPDC005727]